MSRLAPVHVPRLGCFNTRILLRGDAVKIMGFDHVQLAMPQGGEEKARDFYVRLLGLVELAKPSELAARGGAWFQCGTLQLHLGVEQEFRPAKKAHPALRVERLEDLLASLRSAGCEATDDTSVPEIRRAFTADPFGNRIELVAVENAL
jgi:catechol 2,3-dioxygenase-like lactoylglutathione lyase family enzyme